MDYDFADYSRRELLDLIADTEQQIALWSRIPRLSKAEKLQVARNHSLLEQALAALESK